jgi:exosortase A-associated hydrolase 1
MRAACAEQALIFELHGDSLLGVLHAPPAGHSSDTGVVVVVGGPQYRAGSHRQFLHLARRLAQAGHAVLRFDVRGMGDSTGHPRGFEHIGEDIGAAIDALVREQPQVRRVVLWGLCDGASAALMYVADTRDARVRGLVALNPWTRSAVTLARAHVKHYYRQRLMQREFWVKLVSGGVALRAARELVGNLRLAGGRSAGPSASTMTFQQRMASGWRALAGPILLILSGNDYTAKEFLEHVAADEQWSECLRLPSVRRVDVAAADHTFSDPDSRRVMQDCTVEWLQREFASTTPELTGT